MMEIKKRKMACSATNHGFTIPAEFCRIAHVKEGDLWEWLLCKEILVLLPVVEVPIEKQNTQNIVRVQAMKYRRPEQPMRIQIKIDLPLFLIQRHRINTAMCKLHWILNGETLHGELVLEGKNIRNKDGQKLQVIMDKITAL